MPDLDIQCGPLVNLKINAWSWYPVWSTCKFEDKCLILISAVWPTCKSEDKCLISQLKLTLYQEIFGIKLVSRCLNCMEINAQSWNSEHKFWSTVVGDFINEMKTTFKVLTLTRLFRITSLQVLNEKFFYWQLLLCLCVSMRFNILIKINI